MATTSVKERPIIFSSPMVRALLAGTKTQTRRILKLPICWSFPPARLHNGRLCRWGMNEEESIPCPNGVTGDRLWVRETWGETSQAGIHPSDSHIVYKATDPDWQSTTGWRWRSPIHMPRWASRITLEITDVRVQRLQEISEADAAAEGIDDEWLVKNNVPPPRVLSFKALWEDIHGSGAWDANPWVWAITFRLVRGGITGNE